MIQHTGPVGPEHDEQRKQETRNLVRSGRTGRTEEWREPEPASGDQPVGGSRITPDDRRSAPLGMDPGDVEERSELARFLGRSAFPGDRQRLRAVADGNGAPDQVLAELDTLDPGETFSNVQAVARALGIGTETR